MNKHFILSQDLFKEILRTYPDHADSNNNGVITIGKDYICSYNIKEKALIKTRYIQLDFKEKGLGKIKKLDENEDIRLFFLLHTSDEKHFDNQHMSHFQIPYEKLSDFWINESRNNFFYDKTQTVFFMHERSCTAYNSFKKIIEDSQNLPIEQFIEKFQALFNFHDINLRNLKRKEYLEDLAYVDQAHDAERNSMTYSDIKKYYV